MNIFVVDSDPVVAASMLCDQHVCKMPTESAQMLATVSINLGGPAPKRVNGDLYKIAHPKHPCTIWAGNTAENWQWLLTHALALCSEYTTRYKRILGTQSALEFLRDFGAKPQASSLQSFVQAMPDQYRGADPIESYRRFYRGEKTKFARW